MYLNINEQLKNHFINGNGAAGILRQKAYGFSCGVEQFFEARSDVRRLQAAEKLATLILNIYDFGEIQVLRKKVATLELKRLVDYKKQTDHTAHTVYMFLLGIWIFDCSEVIKNGFVHYESEENETKYFILQWVIASLLHDIGYVFYDLENVDLKFYDDLFSLDWIKKNTDDIHGDSENTLAKLWEKFREKYKLVEIDGTNKPLEVIDCLKRVPWLEDSFGISNDGLEVLTLKNDVDKKMKKFAHDVAKSGYADNLPGKVDHAVASGLMLLQYTSIWYWIYRELKEKVEERNTLLRGFKYSEKTMIDYIIPACQAVAYHNMPGKLMKVNFRKNPLLFLAVLCDEMQIWDRFPAGDGNLENWTTDVQIMAEDIIAENTLNERGQLTILFRPINIKAGKHLIDVLDERLDSWNEFIQIT